MNMIEAEISAFEQITPATCTPTIRHWAEAKLPEAERRLKACSERTCLAVRLAQSEQSFREAGGPEAVLNEHLAMRYWKAVSALATGTVDMGPEGLVTIETLRRLAKEFGD
jgi:hypothetical protein